MPDECEELPEQLRLTIQTGSDATSLGPVSEAENARRMKQIDSCEAVCRSWTEVMTELRAKHG